MSWKGEGQGQGGWQKQNTGERPPQASGAWINPLPHGPIYAGTGENRTVRWGEVTSFSYGSSRFSFLMLFQAIIGLWFLGFAISYLIEMVGPTYINNWIAFLFWSIGGAVFIVILQSVFFFLFFSYNGTDTGQMSSYVTPKPVWSAYLSAAFVKEIFLGYIASLIIYIFVFWILLGWLLRQDGAGCCSGPDINALFLEPSGMNYNNYRFAILMVVTLNIVGVIEMIRVFFVHMNPLATVRELTIREDALRNYNLALKQQGKSTAPNQPQPEWQL